MLFLSRQTKKRPPFNMKYSELRKKLEKDGWFIKRHGKEHDIYTHSVKGGEVQVGRHKAQEVAKGTLNNILKMAGLK